MYFSGVLITDLTWLCEELFARLLVPDHWSLRGLNASSGQIERSSLASLFPEVDIEGLLTELGLCVPVREETLLLPALLRNQEAPSWPRQGAVGRPGGSRGASVYDTV